MKSQDTISETETDAPVSSDRLEVEESPLSGFDFSEAIQSGLGGSVVEEPETDDLAFLGDFEESAEESFGETLGGTPDSPGQGSYEWGWNQDTPDQFDPPLLGQLGVEGDAGVARIHVQRQTEEGLRQDLGFLPGTATQRALVKRIQGKPGIYLLAPCNEHGQYLTENSRRLVLPADHPDILWYREGAGTGVAPSAAAPSAFSALMGGGSDPSIWLEHMQETSAQANDKLDRAFQARDDTTRILFEKSAELYQGAFSAEQERAASSNQMQQSYFQKMADAERSHNERMMAAEAERNKVAISGQQQMMTTILGMMTSFMERDSTRAREAREAERARDSQLLQTQMMMLQTMQSSADNFLKLKMTMIDEQARYQAQAAQAQNPMNMIYAASAMLPKLGVDGKDVVSVAKAYLGQGDSEGGASVTGEIFETVRAGIAAAPEIVAAMAGQPAPAAAAPPWVEEEAWEEEPPQPQPAPFVAAQPPPVEAAPPPPAFGMPQEAPQPIAAPPPMPAHRASDLGLGDLTAMAQLQAAPAPTPPAGLIDVQEAQRATVWLLSQIQQSPKLQWPAAIKQTLDHGGENWLAYLRERTIRAAARDAGADDPLIDEFIALIDLDPRTKDIPRG